MKKKNKHFTYVVQGPAFVIEHHGLHLTRNSMVGVAPCVKHDWFADGHSHYVWY